jgi:hypothetical protein
MKHPAIKELYNILKVQDWTSFCPEKERQALLDKWLDKWVVELEQSQSVVNKKYLDSEHLDLVKYKLGEQLGQSLAEECVTYNIEEKNISGQMIALRRKEKK